MKSQGRHPTGRAYVTGLASWERETVHIPSPPSPRKHPRRAVDRQGRETGWWGAKQVTSVNVGWGMAS